MKKQVNNLEDLFWQAKQLSIGPERDAFVQGITSGNESVGRELRRLLRHDGDSNRIFGELNEDTEPSVGGQINLDQALLPDQARIPDQALLRTGEQIGPYKLLEPIGDGGMGVVYLAQQSKPVRRKVALKIIKPGMDSQQVIARFEAERQALAMMDHPNIAKVLDAGTTDAGLPYFVMELVRGIPLTDYCDHAKMPTRARLELFRDACSAIQHAHNKGVIHRDIKPSNVLVTEKDGKPLAKVIDFGVAKALTDNLTDKTLFTGMFQMLGTPLYMSPEQASLSSVDVDVRSDVYSLGVVLYELLSGSLPIKREAVKGLSFEELRNLICDTEPPKPSKRLSTRRNQRATVAEHQGLEANSTHCLVTSELDWIVMTAIEKDRQRRYQSARELSDDVQRYLSGEAVLAHPQFWGYRAGKIARKHRNLLLSVTAVAAAMILGTVISLQQAIVAKRASDLAARNELAANDKAQQLKEMLYARDLRSAAQLFLAGDTDRLTQTLERYQSQDDQDLRGFEFKFFDSLRPVRHELLHQFEQVRINDFIILPNESASIGCHSGGRIFCLDADGDLIGDINAGQGEVHDIQWDAAGRLLSCGEDGSMAVWQWDPGSLPTTEPLRLIKRIQVRDKPLLAITAPGQGSPHSKLAWAGGVGGELHRIELESGETSICFDGYTQPASNFQINDLVYADGSQVLIAYNDGTLKMLDVSESETGGVDETESVLWTFRETPEMRGFRDVEISARGGRLVAAQLLGLVAVIDWQRQPIDWTTQAFPSGIHSVEIDSSGRYMAAGDSTGHVHLVTLQSVQDDGFLATSESPSRRVRTWKPHEGKIEQIRFSDGETSGQSLCLYSVGRDGRVVCSYPFADPPVRFIDVAGMPISSVSKSVRLENEWCRVLKHSATTAKAILEHRKNQVSAFSSAHAEAIDKTFFLINRSELFSASDPTRPIWQTEPNTVVVAFAVSPNGERFAVCIESRSPRRHRIEVFETGVSSPIYTRSSNLANDMTFSPNGKQLAFVQNNDVIILKAQTGALQHRLVSHADSVSDLEFSPDSTMLASVSADLRLILWDPGTGREMWSEKAHDHRANAVAFHPSLPTIATVGHDAMVRFWTTRDIQFDAASRLVGEFPLTEAVPDRLSFSRDGKTLFALHRIRGISMLETR